MKKFFASILAAVFCIFTAGTAASCSVVDSLDLVLENEELLEQVEELTDRVNVLEEENANLRFAAMFPNGVIDTAVELNKLTVNVGDKDGNAIEAVGNAHIVINGGNYNGGNTPFGGAGNNAVFCNSVDALVVINGGRFTVGGLAINDEGVRDTGHIELIYCREGTIEINGGWFEGADDTVWLLNCRDAQYKDGTAKIVVKGGSFVNFDPSNCVSEGEGTNFVAEGYAVVSEIFNEGQEDVYTVYTVVPESELPVVEPEVEAPEHF